MTREGKSGKLRRRGRSGRRDETRRADRRRMLYDEGLQQSEDGVEQILRSLSWIREPNAAQRSSSSSSRRLENRTDSFARSLSLPRTSTHGRSCLARVVCVTRRPSSLTPLQRRLLPLPPPLLLLLAIRATSLAARCVVRTASHRTNQLIRCRLIHHARASSCPSLSLPLSLAFGP